MNCINMKRERQKLPIAFQMHFKVNIRFWDTSADTQAGRLRSKKMLFNDLLHFCKVHYI